MIEPDLAKQLEQMQQQGAQMAQRLQDLTASASDEKSLVTVTVAPGGRLTDITFDPKARRLDTDELRSVILAAAAAAAEEVQQQLADVVHEITAQSGGPQGDVVRDVTKQMDEVRRVVAEQQQRIATMFDPPAK
jgi:DNA-binding protein YbaB